MQKVGIPFMNSIFTRMVITLLLVLTPLYFLGILIFDWSRNLIEQQIFEAMRSQTSFFLSKLDKEIKNIKILQINCLNDEDLSYLAYTSLYMSDYEKTKAISRLKNHLLAIQLSSNYIQKVSAYILPMDLCVNVSVSGSAGVEEIDETVSGIISNVNESKSKSLLLYKDKKLLLYESYPIKGVAGKKPAFIIEIELSQSALKSALTQSDAVTGAKTVMEIPYSGFTITGDDKKTTNSILNIVSKNNMEDNSSIVELESKKYLITYFYSEYLGAIISRYIPEEIIFMPLLRYRLWYWIFSISALVIICLYSFLIYRIIQRPLLILVKAFKEVKEGKLDKRVHHRARDEFSFLYNHFNEMIENIKNLIEQVYKQKILVQKAELKQLQSQINPHFLYNSFFTLQKRIHAGDCDNAERFCEGLGIYFRYITRNSSGEDTLEKEVEHARIYSDIQAIRFSNRVSVEFGSLPERFSKMIVPKLILQPIIENSFVHGLEHKEENARLQVSFTQSEDFLIICIQDNGDQMEDSELVQLENVLNADGNDVNISGIINIHKRIQLAMGENSGIHVSRGELGGLKVDICLELREK